MSREQQMRDQFMGCFWIYIGVCITLAALGIYFFVG